MRALPSTALRFARAISLAAFVFTASGSAQRLDPNLLLRWATVPVIEPRPGVSGASEVVASERLELMRDGQLRYSRRDRRSRGLDRSARRVVPADTVREVTARLRRLCAMGVARSGPASPGDVSVDVLFDDYRGCTFTMPAAEWRAGHTRPFAELVDDLIRRAGAR